MGTPSPCSPGLIAPTDVSPMQQLINVLSWAYSTQDKTIEFILNTTDTNVSSQDASPSKK